MPARGEQFQTIHSEGALLPPDLLQRISSGEVEGLSPESYHLPSGVKVKEAISQSWTKMQRHWKDFQAARKLVLESDETGALATREKWLLPLFQELGYGRLTGSKSPEIDGKTFPIERFWNHIPIHLIGFKLPLDKRTKGARGAATAIPHSMIQEFLNRSPGHLWAFLSNGLELRILRDNAALSRQSYVEFDLESMMEGEVYSDFAILWLVCHQSRLEADKPENCQLEKWSKLATDEGTRILEDLRKGVQTAIEALGRGFLAHPHNGPLIDKLQSGTLTRDNYYRQILRIVYRFLFLFVAEDRDLLHPRGPEDAEARAKWEAVCSRYDRYYSLRHLRDLAEDYRGSKHADLWHTLSLVFDSLDSVGCPSLALPALGSFLWSRAAIPDLNGPAPKSSTPVPQAVFLRNEDLLAAIRALAFTEKNKVLRAVNYRNLGSEEWGSVYESLLELKPDVNIHARMFSLATVAGNERKTSGSYYTPTTLVNCLLDSALEPVIADAIKGKTGTAAESALLALKICDPACGSGHILIAAAHRLARHLARVRTGESEPSPADYQHALRDVIRQCIYGVDLNPMAVELCKVSLWMESLEPGKPLSFLDHRIQAGNSLLGTTPALMAQNIPDGAFEPIECDDKLVAKEFKKRNKDERKGQGSLFGVPEWTYFGDLATNMMQLDSTGEDTVADVHAKQAKYAEFVQSSGYEHGRLLADLWCSAFSWRKDKDTSDAPTHAIFERVRKNPHDLTPWMKGQITSLSKQFYFLHWHLAFPTVFRVPTKFQEAENRESGWSGGFDVVLGNPPWEKVQPTEQEFFSLSRPDIAAAAGAQRKKMIESLAKEDKPLHDHWLSYKREIEAFVHTIKDGVLLPLSGTGRLNTYSLFLERAWQLMGRSGMLGLVVQSGLATDDSNKELFTAIVSSEKLTSLYDFENGLGLFPGVHPEQKFSLVTMTNRKSGRTDFAFWLRTVDELHDPERHFQLTSTEFDRMSPNTGSCPTFHSKKESELVKAIYARAPVIKRDGDVSGNLGWPLRFVQLVNLTSDSKHFVRHADIPVNERDSFTKVYEGKLTQIYDHRALTFGTTAPEADGRELSLTERDDPRCETMPQFWMPEQTLRSFTTDLNWAHKWFACFHDVANPNNERTAIFTVIPHSAVGNSIPIIVGDVTVPALCAFMAAANSFVFDFVARRRIGSRHLNFFVLKQLPMPLPAVFESNFAVSPSPLQAWTMARVLELSYTSWDLQNFAVDCGYSGPPFRWKPDRRFIIRCELDAAYFHLFLGTQEEWKGRSPELLAYFPSPREAAAYILDNFSIVQERDTEQHGTYRTRDTILSIYDNMADAIREDRIYQTRLDPAPGEPGAAHKLQLDPVRAIVFVGLLLKAWKKAVSRQALEIGIILVFNDAARRSILSRTNQGGRTANSAPADVIIPGFDFFLSGLQAQAVVSVATTGHQQSITAGNATRTLPDPTPEDAKRVKEALEAFELIKDIGAEALPLGSTNVEFITV